MIFNLVHDEARRRAIVAVSEAPQGWRVKVEPPKRTLEQNAAIHPLIEEIAKAAGKPLDDESLRVLRYLMLEQWRAETKRQPMFERSLDGMRLVDVSKGTSDLHKPDCSEFLDWLGAWAAEHGVAG